MIKFDPQVITEPDRNKIAEFLAHPGRVIFETALKAQIAKLQTSCLQSPMQKPEQYLNVATMPQGFYEDLNAALRLQITLDVLKEVKIESLTKGQIKIT